MSKGKYLTTVNRSLSIHPIKAGNTLASSESLGYIRMIVVLTPLKVQLQHRIITLLEER